MELDFLNVRDLPVLSPERALARSLGEIIILSLTCALSNVGSKHATLPI